MNYICPRTGRLCASSGCFNGSLCNQFPTLPINTQTPLMQGWECPRCHKINAPYKSTCDCIVPVQSTILQSTHPTQQPTITDEEIEALAEKEYPRQIKSIMGCYESGYIKGFKAALSLNTNASEEK